MLSLDLFHLGKALCKQEEGASPLSEPWIPFCLSTVAVYPQYSGNLPNDASAPFLEDVFN